MGMIQHIVVWKLLEEANGNRKEENMSQMREMLIALPKYIPQIRSLSVVQNVNMTERNADLALITTFDQLSDLDIYSSHPEHVKVAQFVGSIVSARSAIDYEI
jgi:hypothetical protein